jgi:hypothetical protein
MIKRERGKNRRGTRVEIVPADCGSAGAERENE